MKKIGHIAWIVIGVIAAIGIGHDWYAGEAANGGVWLLAIFGALGISVSAAERLAESLRS